MKYMGSKAKHGHQILITILDDLINRIPNFNHKDHYWVEPFVGGCNMIDKIGSFFKGKIGNDINAHLIEMFKKIKEGWTPPDNLSEEKYKELNEQSKVIKDNPLIAFAGIGCSFGAKWFGGYARGKDSKGIDRNYCLESKKNILNQKDKIMDVVFTSGEYDKIDLPKNSVIYCDPPYDDTTKYKNEFDHNKFWQWCDDKIKAGHFVYVSEYKTPDGWICLWEKPITNSSFHCKRKDVGNKKAIEKLFTKYK